MQGDLRLCTPTPPGSPADVKCPAGVVDLQSVGNHEAYLQDKTDLVPVSRIVAQDMNVFLDYHFLSSCRYDGLGLTAIRQILRGGRLMALNLSSPMRGELEIWHFGRAYLEKNSADPARR